MESISFSLPEETVFEETVWNQQAGGVFDVTDGGQGTPLSVEYSYQSHPKLKVEYLPAAAAAGKYSTLSFGWL